MKIKVVIVILVVAWVGLGIAFFTTKKQADDQHAADVNSIEEFSNQMVTANWQINELGQVNLTLSNDLASSHAEAALSAEQLVQLSNSLAAASSTLADTKNSLADTQNSLLGAQELVTNLNTRIADLEARNRDLDAQASALSNQLAQLTVQIEGTRNQLAVAETNNTYLQGELQKQLAQKAELEHKFNDLDELRAKLRTMKDQMFVARHLELMRNDNGSLKGSALLMSRTVRPSGPPIIPMPASTYDLNVEVGSDGSVRVIPPLGGTNRPAH